MSASRSTDPKLAEALAECDRLREENRQLRGRLGIPRMETSDPLPSVSDMQGAVTSKSTPDGKVKLFRNLFRGREDVYAVRWEGRNGKAGYSPAYHRIWGTSFRNAPDKPKEYFPLTDQVIHDHLTGKLTAGVYLVGSSNRSLRAPRRRRTLPSHRPQHPRLRLICPTRKAKGH